MLSHVPLHMFQIDQTGCISVAGLLIKHYCVYELMKHIRAPCCSNRVSEITFQFLQASKILWYNLKPDYSENSIFAGQTPSRHPSGPEWLLVCHEWMLLCFLPWFPGIFASLCLIFVLCRKRKGCTGTKSSDVDRSRFTLSRWSGLYRITDPDWLCL